MLISSTVYIHNFRGPQFSRTPIPSFQYCAQEWGQPFIVSVAEAVQAVKYRRKTRDAPPADSKSCETDDDTTAELSGVPVPRIKLPHIRASNAVFPDTSSTGRQSQLPETPAASDTALSSSDEATDGESVMSSLHEHRVLDLERYD